MPRSFLNAADPLGAKSAIGDGQLFLIHILLILRDIVHNVDLAQKDEPRAVGADANSLTVGTSRSMRRVLMGQSS